MANIYSTDLEKSSSQYWSVADTASLSITGDMTLEMWVKLESAPSNSTYCLARKYAEGGNNRSYMFRYQDTGGTKRFEFRQSTSGTGASTSVITYNYTLSTATWTHLAFAYDASAGEIEVFINGVSNGTATGVRTSVYDGTAPFEIGGNSSDGDYFDGLIKDVRVWNDIRTGTEINDNKSNCDLSVSEAGLVSWWKFENDGTDATSNGNDLTNNNSATFSTDVPYTCASASTENALSMCNF